MMLAAVLLMAAGVLVQAPGATCDGIDVIAMRLTVVRRRGVTVDELIRWSETGEPSDVRTRACVNGDDGRAMAHELAALEPVGRQRLGDYRIVIRTSARGWFALPGTLRYVAREDGRVYRLSKLLLSSLVRALPRLQAEELQNVARLTGDAPR